MALTLLPHLRECLANGVAAMAAGQQEAGLRWLDRAYRLAPNHPSVTFMSAAALVLTDPAAAMTRFAALVGTWPEFREPHFGVVAAALRHTGAQAAARHLSEALHRFGLPAHPDLDKLARDTVRAAGAPGWISLDGQSGLTVCAMPPGQLALLEVRQAGIVLRRQTLQGGVEYAARIQLPGAHRVVATLDGVPLLGSGLSPTVLLRVEAVLLPPANGRVRGYAWMPGMPDTSPQLVLRLAGTADRPFRPRGKPKPMLWNPAAKMRGFSFPLPASGHGDGAISVISADGRDIAGSPVFLKAVPPPSLPSPRAGLDVIIPVVKGVAELKRCLASLRDDVPPDTRIVIVNDGSSDPALLAFLSAAAGGALVLHHAQNRGYPAAINTGLRHAAGRDVILLNPDTLLPPGWADRLAAAAYATPDTGSATPLSNEASILSYPNPAGGNVAPRGAALRRLDRLCQGVNEAIRIDLPSAVGFCMYVRSDCLAAVGGFREDAFAQGYGEENEWCCRASSLGWRHVAAADVFVSHFGGRSFGSRRAGLMARNRAVLNGLYPGYDAGVQRFLARGTLAAVRRNLDMVRWRQGGTGPLVLLISHGRGGGVERFVQERCGKLAAEGHRTLVVRPGGGKTVRLEAEAALDCPNLEFRLPAEWDVLLAWLRSQRIDRVELHHTLDHVPGIDTLAERLGVAQDIYVHDATFFCPRVTMLGRSRRYCGEPKDPALCDACVAELGSVVANPPPVAALRAHSAALFAQARQVIVPCEDVARRVRRYASVVPVVRPWQEDSALPSRLWQKPAGPIRVAVVGSLNRDKGMDLLRDCAQEAAARTLPVQFVLIGHSASDEALLNAGVFVTGRFAPHEVLPLLRREQPSLGFVPSVVPETWCYALTALLEAGLDVLAFDIGAQAERIRRTGRGRLLPAGVSVEKVLTALIAMCPGG